MRFAFVGLLIIGAVGAAETGADEPRHLIVYKEAGRYAAWPANHGIWSWGGDEILVGFEIGYHKGYNPAVNPQSQTPDTHAIDYERPAEHVLARSLDGGETWAIERHRELIPPEGEKVSRVPTGKGGAHPTDSPGRIDFTHPDFAMTLRMLSYHVGPSRFLYTLDRGRSWHGPYKLPDLGFPGIAARTDYLVNGRHELLAFLTAAKSNRRQGRVICARTTDGGGSWELLGEIGPEPGPGGKANMPSSVRLSESTILVARRRVEGIDLYRTDDGGATWRFFAKPVDDTGSNGNPPDMLALQDGRLALIYGYRSEPYGIRVVFSSDQGATWSPPVALRDDGGYWDVGYPRTVQRPDGKLVTVYYFTDARESLRYIAATIWDPRQLKADD
jgi:hypothetical protein